MANGTGNTIKLLKNFFSRDEWERLLQHPEFLARLTQLQTHDDVERVVELGGDILLTEWWQNRAQLS
jgi:hypothetical protein